MASFPFRPFLKEFLVILSLYLGIRLLLFFWNGNEELSLDAFMSGMLGYGIALALVLAMFRVMKAGK